MPNAAAVSLVKGAFSRLGIEPPPPPPNPLARYKDDPIGFAADCLKILDKRAQTRPLIFNSVQQHYLANATRRDVILKARQMGMSTAIQANYFRRAVTSTALVGTLSHEDKSTQKLRLMTKRFYDLMPDELRPKRHYSNSWLTTYPLTKSEVVTVTAGNKNTGRGGTYTHIHCSEVAFYDDAEGIMSGVLQGGDPEIVLESTPNGAQGYFYNLCMEAIDGRNDWKFFFYPWWSDPTYRVPLAEGETLDYTAEEWALIGLHELTAEQIKWRRIKVRELKNQFKQEYPEDPKSCFLTSGNGYFGDVSGIMTAPLNPSYQPDHRYFAGMDFGQMQDFTVLIIIDATAGVEVARLRINRMPWREMRRRAAELCKYWHVSVLCPEFNSMGSTNVEELREELRAIGCRTRIVPFMTSNASKADVASALNEAFQSGDLLLQSDAQQTAEINAFIAKQTVSGAWQLAAREGEHDDMVIALMLAWYARNAGRMALAQGDAPEELSEWRG